jgi:hypothetical protein
LAKGYWGIGFNAVLHHPQVEIDFTGWLVLGRDFISKLYVHMGFHPPWKYQEIMECRFTNGLLQESADLSRDVAEIRRAYLPKVLPPRFGMEPGGLGRRLASCFQGSYGFLRE